MVGGGGGAAAPPAEDGAGDAEPPADDDGGAGGATASSSGGDGGSVDPTLPATVEAVLPAPSVKVGETIPVEIRISNASNVASVPFHLKFNPAVLKLSEDPGGQQGTFLVQPGTTTHFITKLGPSGSEVVVGLSLLGGKSGSSGDGLLATLYFDAIGPGASPLEFTHASVRGPDAGVIDSSFSAVSLEVTE